MFKFLKIVSIMLICIMLGGCTILMDRWGFTIKGRLVDINNKPLEGCSLNYERDGLSPPEKDTIGSKFRTGEMTGARGVDDIIVLIDCGEDYEQFRSPPLHTFGTEKIDFGTIVILPKR